MALSKRESRLSFADAHSLLAYNPLTGILRWKVDRLSGKNKVQVRAGDIAGHKDKDGYVVIGINGTVYQGHRVAWLLMTGSWPECQIDHHDLDRWNNRWNNLRPATFLDNAANKTKRRNNTSGFKCVFFRKSTGRYIAYIGGPKNRKHLGCFDTGEEAHAAYCAEAKIRYGEFARA